MSIPDEIAILRINELVESIGNLQICIEPTNDATLGYKTFGWKDASGVSQKALAKNRAGQLSSLQITSLSGGGTEYAKVDNAGNLFSGAISISDLPANLVLQDGSRPFLSTISGIDPTLDTHLATKKYVDMSVGTGLWHLYNDDVYYDVGDVKAVNNLSVGYPFTHTITKALEVNGDALFSNGSKAISLLTNASRLAVDVTDGTYTSTLAHDNLYISTSVFDTRIDSAGVTVTDGVNEMNLDPLKGLRHSGITPPTHTESLLYYNTDCHCWTAYNDQSPVALNIGEELWSRMKNLTGSTGLNGAVVYIDGADSGVATFDLADATDLQKSRTIGMLTQDINNTNEGYVANFGTVRELNTSAFSVGDIVYLDPATPGGLTSTIPNGGSFAVMIGVITVSSATVGELKLNINISDYTAETVQVTGWPEGRNAYAMSFDDVTRTLTISPKAPATSFRWYENGVKYEKTTDSKTIPDEEGSFILYYIKDALVHVKDPVPAQIDSIIRNNTTVAYVYWNATDSKSEYLLFEPHGAKFGVDNHSYHHFIDGARYVTGLGLTDIVADNNGSLDVSAQFGVETGVISDEDVIHLPPTIASTTGYKVYYQIGAEANPSIRSMVKSGFSVLTDVDVGIGSTGRPVYNELTGGVWQLTVVPSGYFTLAHGWSNNSYNSSELTYVTMGQEVYSNVGNARAGAEVEILSITAGELAGPESVALGTVIFETKDSYSNAVKARVRTTDLGDDYVDWRTTTALGGGGTGSTVTQFPDDQFTIFNATDLTKIIDFDASGITAGATRTYTAADHDGILGAWEASGSDIIYKDGSIIIGDSPTATYRTQYTPFGVEATLHSSKWDESNFSGETLILTPSEKLTRRMTLSRIDTYHNMYRATDTNYYSFASEPAALIQEVAGGWSYRTFLPTAADQLIDINTPLSQYFLDGFNNKISWTGDIELDKAGSFSTINALNRIIIGDVADSYLGIGPAGVDGVSLIQGASASGYSRLEFGTTAHIDRYDASSIIRSSLQLEDDDIFLEHKNASNQLVSSITLNDSGAIIATGANNDSIEIDSTSTRIERNGVDVVTVTDDKVGIGTGSPAGDLDIFSSSDNAFLNVKTITSNKRGILQFWGNPSVQGNAWGSMTFNDTGGVARAFVGSARGDTATKGDLDFQTHDGTSLASRLRITPDGNVGIGTNTPGGLLDVSKTQNAGTISYVQNGSTGVDASCGNVFIPAGNNLQLISYANTHSTKGLENWIFSSSVNASIILGTNSLERLKIDNNGSLYMPEVYNDTTASAANLYIDSNGQLFRSTSSKKYKEKIKYDGVDGNKALQLKPVSFEGNDKDKKYNTGREYIGFIAEDVEEVDSRLVDHDSEGNPDAVHYGNITALNNQAIQDQHREIEELKAEIEELREAIAKLQK